MANRHQRARSRQSASALCLVAAFVCCSQAASDAGQADVTSTSSSLLLFGGTITGSLQESIGGNLENPAGDGLPPVVHLEVKSPQPTNYVTSIPGGARISMASIGGHLPGDNFRTEFVVETTSATDASIEETSSIFEMWAKTGYTPDWQPQHDYASHTKIHGGDHAIFENITACKTGSLGSGPAGTKNGQADGDCRWNYVQVGGGDGKSSILATTNVFPGGGQAWGGSIMMGVKPKAWEGYGGFGVGLEIDTGNEAHECNGAPPYGCSIFGLFMNGNGTFPSTVGLAIGGGQGYNVGIQFYEKGALDTTIADASNASTGILEQGKKKIASYRDLSASPVAISLEGHYAYAALLDQSTAPYGLRLTGRYSEKQIEAKGFSVDTLGGLVASSYRSGAFKGVDCSNGPSPQFAVHNGLVTHC